MSKYYVICFFALCAATFFEPVRADSVAVGTPCNTCKSDHDYRMFGTAKAYEKFGGIGGMIRMQDRTLLGAVPFLNVENMIMVQDP